MAIHSGQEKPTRVAGSFTDITRHKDMEKKLALRAFYDPLTGLPNRALFMDSLSRAYAYLDRHPKSLFAIFFLDLDHLKRTNDLMGHQAGDELLIEFARRVKSCVRPNDLVARMAGDEFTILLEDIKDNGEGIEIAERILNIMRIPFSLEGQEVASTVSIGIAFSNCGKEEPTGLLKAADLAMYQAKVAGKARFEVFGKTQSNSEED
jgi:diguanylate cyclase (GGDEF)-like protein